MTFQTLVNEMKFSSIDLLQIDTEGFDDVIVGLALDLENRLLPRAINFEHNHLKKKASEPFFDRLTASGYVWTNSDWDTFCIKYSK